MLSSQHNHNNAIIPIPQNFVITGCSIYKLKFSWSPVIGHYNLYNKFEYEIFAEETDGHRTKRKITSECDAIIENMIPGEYTFYIRAVELSSSLTSEFSDALDIKIPKDNKKQNTISSNTPRAAKWISKQHKVVFTWKSPHSFYGDVSYELLFNNKVLGRTYVPPLIVSKNELDQFDFTSGCFQLRSIIILKDKNESNCIPIPYPNEIREVITKRKNEIIIEDTKEIEIEEKTEKRERRHNPDDESNIYIWVCAPDPLPDLTLIPFGDPDFSTYSFQKLDEENGIYLCSWPSFAINELDHYFLFGISDPKINLAAVPTFDINYRGYWRVKCKQEIKFYLVYTHKVLHRFAHAISGGVQGMYHTYGAILRCIVDNMGDAINFKCCVKTMVTVHEQWSQQSQSMNNELQDFFFSKMEYYADSVDYEDLDITAISVILLCMYWLLRTSHHKVHYRHLHHSLNGLLIIIKSSDNTYSNVVDLVSDIMGSYVLELLTLFQSFAIEKLKKDRSRYFDLVWYQILYLSALKVIENERNEEMLHDNDMKSIHNEFMSEIDQILFNPNYMARSIGAEDLRAITQIYIGLLKNINDIQRHNDGKFYKECGVKLEELIIENHLKRGDILDTMTFMDKHELSFYIFAAILYRNRHYYTFTEYSDGREYLPELDIVSDHMHKTHNVLQLSRSGFYGFVQQQKIPKDARCSVIHFIFSNFKNNKDFDEKQLFCWYKVMQKLVLKYKDFEVCDQILYELRALDERNRKQKQKQNNKYLKSLQSDCFTPIMQEFEASLPVCLHYANPIVPMCLHYLNSKDLYGILSVLLHLRYSKCENIENENKDDFTLHLFGILMLELNELFFAEKYLMKAIMKQANNPYGHYFADLSLLKMIKNNDFIASFKYICTAMDMKHTESYNKLILLLLYNRLMQFNYFAQNVNPTLICTKRFNLNNIMFCNYYQKEQNSNNNNKNNDDDDEAINNCLRNYYNALRELKAQQYTESIKLIDEIYKYINNVNMKEIQAKCHDIIESIKAMNLKIKKQNQALIKSKNDRNNKEIAIDDDDVKEELVPPEMAINKDYMPPNDDSD